MLAIMLFDPFMNNTVYQPVSNRPWPVVERIFLGRDDVLGGLAKISQKRKPSGPMGSEP